MAGRGLALPPNPQQQNADTEKFPQIDDIDLMNLSNDDFQSLMNQTNMMTDTDTDMDSNNMYADDLFTQSVPGDQLQQAQMANMGPTPMSNNMPMSLGMPHSMIPDTLMGPSYNPMIGWYYPAIPMNASNTGFSTPDISEGYTPMSSTPIPSQMGSNKPAIPPNPFGPTRPKSKRKYGPSAYLEQQARNRAEGALRARNASVADADYTSKAKQRSDRSNKTLTGSFRNKKTGPLIVQVCVCNDKQAVKIKRPKNAFILYRSANSKKIQQKLGTNTNQDVSKKAAQNWHNEPPNVKAHFFELAEQEKQRHAELNPGYVYQPGQNNKNKFGSQSCTCGAYRANMKALLDQQTGQDGDEDEEEEELDEYLPTGRGQPARQAAPVANMMMPARSIPDPTTLGLTPRQQAEAQADAETLKRKRHASVAFNQTDSEGPLAKRRSPRLNTSGISYTEPADDEDDIFGSTAAPAHNTRSSASRPKTPSPRQAEFTSYFDDNNSDVFDFNAPFTAPADLSFDDIFGEDANLDFGFDNNPGFGDMGENIVVADRRPSSRGRASVAHGQAGQAGQARSRRSSRFEQQQGGTSPQNTRYGLRRRS